MHHPSIRCLRQEHGACKNTNFEWGCSLLLIGPLNAQGLVDGFVPGVMGPLGQQLEMPHRRTTSLSQTRRMMKVGATTLAEN